ncbi:conserved hypothetical protein [Ricinus communis]|uniref:RALFL33 n=1 Tax=Ricinus communis TaxID=3988 RepID=B9S4V1_RICCO|nr:conserved hypothetical protein [Ricinus communis]
MSSHKNLNMAIKLAFLLFLVTIIDTTTMVAEARALHRSSGLRFATNKMQEVTPNKGSQENPGPNPCTYLPITDPRHCQHH